MRIPRRIILSAEERERKRVSKVLFFISLVLLIVPAYSFFHAVSIPTDSTGGLAKIPAAVLAAANANGGKVQLPCPASYGMTTDPQGNAYVSVTCVNSALLSGDFAKVWPILISPSADFVPAFLGAFAALLAIFYSSKFLIAIVLVGQLLGWILLLAPITLPVVGVSSPKVVVYSQAGDFVTYANSNDVTVQGSAAPYNVRSGEQTIATSPDSTISVAQLLPSFGIDFYDFVQHYALTWMLPIYLIGARRGSNLKLLPILLRNYPFLRRIGRYKNSAGPRG